MLSRLARWWLARAERRAAQPAEPPRLSGECICGAVVTGDDLHLIVAISDDDTALGIEGSTAMSADFCAEHCPGGCLRGCVASTT